MIAALIFAGAVQAQSLTLAPSAVVLGLEGMGVRPGLRVGFEPSSAIGLELAGDYGRGYDAVAALSGRAWLVGEGDTGVFLLGRGAIGVAGYGEDRLGPVAGLCGGFGGRPARWLNLEASVGPEWVGLTDLRWRTELTAGFVFALDGDGGTARHRPTRKVK